MEYRKSKVVSLKAHPSYNEKWLQQQLVSDVGILGLGNDLVVRDVERRQPGAGRIDLILQEPGTTTRYEVEIQLGATDESHIIRTLEYWDNERRRFPQYDHIAVIVAEAVTARFLNVINLFNQAIPLIAIQMSALEVDDVLTLHATKVLDIALPAPEEEDEPGEETNRTYWENRSSRAVLELVDKLLEVLNEYGAPMELKYNKHYIGLQKDGVADNFVDFKPRRKHLQMEFRLPRTDELDARIEDVGLTVYSYDKTFGRYKIGVTPGDVESNEHLVRELIQLARGVPVAVEPQADTAMA
jgi:predicted transport protein